MDIKGKNFLLIGGAGLIGSHTLDQLLKEDVAKVTIFDNFTRGSFKNIEEAMKDSRVKIFEHGGDINQIDILEKSMQNQPQKSMMKKRPQRSPGGGPEAS